MNALNKFILALYTGSFRKEDGQGALEYIGIVVGLVVLIAAGFRIAGVNIFTEASNFVTRVVNEAGGSSGP